MRIYPTRMSIITVMQTPADATKPHEKKKETRGNSKKHTRRHTLPNLFVSLPLVPFLLFYFIFCICCVNCFSFLAQKNHAFISSLSLKLVYVRVMSLLFRCVVITLRLKEQYTKEMSNLKLWFSRFFFSSISFTSIKRSNK